MAKADATKNKVDSIDETKITPNKVSEMFRTAEDWNDIRQIMVNVNYFVGNQWIGWNRAERRIQLLPVYDNQERITLNKIRPRVMTLLAKHTKNKIKFDVVAASTEQKDIDAAKGAHRFLKFQWEELDFTTKTRDIFLNMLIKKRCWVKTWFDAEDGENITPTEEDGEIYEKWKQGDQKPIHTGVIKARVCDPLTIFSDPAATTEEEIRWIIERKARDVDEIFEEYGVKVSPDAGIDYLNSYDLTRVNSDGVGANESARKKNMALVYELWYRPCRKYPKGLKVTVAGNQELDYNDEAGELPYSLFGYIPIPGNLNFDAIVTDMIPVQRGINIKRSMMATHAKRLGNTLWMLPLGSGVDEEELTNEEGGFVHYNPINGAKPERAEAPNIPNFYDRDLAHDNNDMDDMSGAREVSQGTMPQGLDTMGGLQIMVEQENEKLTVGAQNYEQGMKKVMQRILRLIKKHYTEERQGRILGEDNEIEIISFNGSDLTGDEDVTVVEGSSLPEMKAAQQDRIMTIWKMGGIVKKDGTPDADRFLRLMDMGDANAMYDQNQLDENKAKMENEFFENMGDDPKAFKAYAQWMQQKQHAEAINAELQKQGQEQGVDVSAHMEPIPPTPKGVPVVRDFHDHEVHIYNHNTFRKSSEYDELPDELQKMVDAHVKEHEDMMSQSPQNQAANAQAQALQQENDLKQQDLQLKAQGQQTDAQLQAAKIQAEKERSQSQVGAAQLKAQADLAKQAMQHQHEANMAHLTAGHQLGNAAILAEQSHGHNMQSSQISHGQQLERDKQIKANAGQE